VALGYTLRKYISQIEEPFEIGEDVFRGADHATLYVPLDTKERYKTTTGWNKFGNIVEHDI
jgi:hypothetical protein